MDDYRVSEMLADDAAALASVVKSLGGNVIPGEEFDFSFPVNITKTIVPHLNNLGIGVRSLQEVVGTNPRTGKTENICLARAYRKPDEQKG